MVKKEIYLLFNPTLKAIYIDFLTNNTFNDTAWSTLNKSVQKKYGLYNHGKINDDTYVRAYAKGTVITILRTKEANVSIDLENNRYSISPESISIAQLVYQENNYAESYLEENGLIKGDSDEI